MQTLWKELCYAARGLARNRGFTLVVVLTLALGIGTNTAVFSITNALLLRSPKGVAAPDELVQVGRTFNGSGFNTVSYPDYADCRDQNQSFVDLAAYRDTTLFLDTAGAREPLSGMLVTGNYFRTLGTHADVGRLLMPEDNLAPGANPEAVISHSLWERGFASDTKIVGRVISFNNSQFTIVGVMQPEFTGTGVAENVDVWLPLTMYSQANPVFYEKRFEAREISWLNVLGRLRSGVTDKQAHADLISISRRLEQIYPNVDKGLGVSLAPGLGLQPQRRDDARPRLGTLLGVTGLLLLIVCANVANLLLAKGTARRKELAVRHALGAGHARIVRQLLIEALLLAAAGGALGVAFAFWSRALLLNFNFLTGVRLSPQDLVFDARVLGFGLLVSLLTGLAFGVVPAIDGGQADLQLLLNGRSSTAAPRARFRAALVVGQIAVSLVVLVAAGLFLQTLRHAESADLGFDINRILMMPIDVGRRGYSEEQGKLFYQRLVEQVRTIPGVEAATWSVTVPLSGSWRTGFRTEDQPITAGDMPCDYNIVTPRYFETTGIALIQGREFTEHDLADSPRVVIINATFARLMFPHDNPLGKRLVIPRFKGDHSFSEIVGVANDVKYERLTESPRAYFYLPLSQAYQSGAILLVRARGDDSSALVGAVRREVQALDPTLPVNARTLADRLQAALAPQRSAVRMLGIFGVLGLGLASLGLYGLLAYSVRQRQQEIAVRMALGADSRAILKGVFKQGALLIMGGVTIGLLISLAATRALATLLYGVSPADPLTYAVVSIVLVIAGLAACYIPAWRATKIDPLAALRQE